MGPVLGSPQAFCSRSQAGGFRGPVSCVKPVRDGVLDPSGHGETFSALGAPCPTGKASDSPGERMLLLNSLWLFFFFFLIILASLDLGHGAPRVFRCGTLALQLWHVGALVTPWHVGS